MSDISSVSGLSNLSRDLYYQYMINHNPTSNMLRAISGGDEDSYSGSANLMSAVSNGLGSSLSGISGLDSLGSLAGLSGNSEDLLDTSLGLSNFSSILETYMNAQRAEAATMAESMSSVLDQAAESEDTSSLTYRTVQEIYEYFMEKSSSADQGMSSVTDQLQTGQTGNETRQTAVSVFDLEKQQEMDFDSLEQEQMQSIESAFQIG